MMLQRYISINHLVLFYLLIHLPDQLIDIHSVPFKGVETILKLIHLPPLQQIFKYVGVSLDLQYKGAFLHLENILRHLLLGHNRDSWYHIQKLLQNLMLNQF